MHLLQFKNLDDFNENYNIYKKIVMKLLDAFLNEEKRL